LASLLHQFYRFNAGTKWVVEAAVYLNAPQVDIRTIRSEDMSSDYTMANILLEGFGDQFRVLNTLLLADDLLTSMSCVIQFKEEEMAPERVITTMAAIRLQKVVGQGLSSC
jgi:hypothetical protein